jgi:hypothetical protein
MIEAIQLPTLHPVQNKIALFIISQEKSFKVDRKDFVVAISAALSEVGLDNYTSLPNCR